MFAGVAEICVAAACAFSDPAFLPKQGDFRMQHIHRQPSEANWPFTVDEGLLLCIEIFGRPEVYFATGVSEFGLDAESDQNIRTLILAKNPFDLAVINFTNADLFVEQVDPMRRLEMVKPYMEMGEKLCDLPKGTVLPSGEL
ncbi:MAG: hypothetical protein AAGG69_02760 [Pseudomonadota bacterium]